MDCILVPTQPDGPGNPSALHRNTLSRTYDAPQTVSPLDVQNITPKCSRVCLHLWNQRADRDFLTKGCECRALHPTDWGQPRWRVLAMTSMYLVKYDPLDIPDKIGPPVEHGPKDLSGHDEAGSFRVDGHVARDETHVSETGLQIHHENKQRPHEKI